MYLKSFSATVIALSIACPDVYLPRTGIDDGSPDGFQYGPHPSQVLDRGGVEKDVYNVL